MRVTSIQMVGSSLLIAGAVMAVPACNSRTPLLDSPVLTTAPSSFTNSVPALNAAPFLEVVPSGVMGGQRGRIYMSFPAPPAEGTVVSVRASDPAVVVSPSQIEWPRNAFSAEVSFTTPVVAADRNVQFVVSTPDQSRAAQLAVWAPAPYFFAFSGDRNAPEGPGRSGRLLQADMQIEAWCHLNEVSINVRPHASTGESAWALTMAAPRRSPLGPGVYDAGNLGQTSNPYALYLSTSRLSNSRCPFRNRFTVHDIELRPPGTVVRLWATIEQTCTDTGATTRVDVRVLNPPLPASPFAACNIQ